MAGGRSVAAADFVLKQLPSPRSRRAHAALKDFSLRSEPSRRRVSASVPQAGGHCDRGEIVSRETTHATLIGRDQVVPRNRLRESRPWSRRRRVGRREPREWAANRCNTERILSGQIPQGTRRKWRANRGVKHRQAVEPLALQGVGQGKSTSG